MKSSIAALKAVVLNGFALLGALLVFCALVVYTYPDLLDDGEQWLYAHLYERKVIQAQLDVEPEALERVTAVDLLDLSEEQAATAFWLSKKYRVAPEPMGALVAKAYELGEKRGLDPQLILSVVAIESRFNPFAQSSVGAQGLMQVMTNVHEDKYAHFGGSLAAFDPLSNMQVGSLILKDCIDRFGGIQRGLVCYVGAAKLPNDGGYASKVLAEQAKLKSATSKPLAMLPAAFKAAWAKRQAEQRDVLLTAEQSAAPVTLGVAVAQDGANSSPAGLDLALNNVAALLEPTQNMHVLAQANASDTSKTP
ncbi:lytic transglycosylase domain-containing protein [Lampropedia puyangensis]|nr:lytic transglycosylase domain-containing protein [Lampropedia puyangensis]